MRNKIVIHFYVRDARKDRKGEAPIYLRITVNGERAEISTGRRVNPSLPCSLPGYQRRGESVC